MSRIKITSLLALACVFVLAESALGWTSIGRWWGTDVTIRAASVSFPSGSSWRTALGTTTSRINDNPSPMRFTQWYDDTSVGFSNGQNEVWFTSDSSYSPAVCFTWYDFFGMIREADVLFYNGESYTTSMYKTSSWTYGGWGRPFETTAIHEYGHAAGLGHEADEYNIMGQDWTHITTNGSYSRSYLGEDASDGLYDIYGANSGNVQDVSVTVMKRTGRSGEYSSHGFCDMRTSSGSLLSRTSDYEGQPRYRVSPGQQVRVEFTYENNGESTQSPSLGFYISTNNYISTGDRLIATARPTISRDGVFTYAYTITIPSDLSRYRTHFLGVYIDNDFRISERTGSNNMAYHPIYVQ